MLQKFICQEIPVLQSTPSKEYLHSLCKFMVEPIIGHAAQEQYAIYEILIETGQNIVRVSVSVF